MDGEITEKVFIAGASRGDVAEHAGHRMTREWRLPARSEIRPATGGAKRRRQPLKIILCASLLVLLMPSAYAASLLGDSADGKRLYDANCMGCHDTGVFTQGPARSVFGCAEKAVGQLHSSNSLRAKRRTSSST